jgi:integrase
VDALGLPWGALRYQHTQAVRAKLGEQYTAATANRHLAALRGVLKEAWRLGYMSAEDYQRAVDIRNIQGGSTVTQAERGRHLSAGELGALLAVCDDGTRAGLRDGALIALAYSCGLRRAELAGLSMESIDHDRMQLIVHGKRNKARAVPVVAGAWNALQDWLGERGPWAGPVFTRVRKGDTIEYGGLTEQGIYTIMAARAEQAGVRAFTPHDMRRTFAGDMLDAGADIATVQKLMGHESPTTTAQYDRRDERTKRAAVNKLHVPYQRKHKLTLDKSGDRA